MVTLREAGDREAERVFVGRGAELATFSAWLAGTDGRHDLLNVCGPGGVGKSALVGAFARLAARLGRPTVVLDGAEVRPTPEGFDLALARAIGTADPIGHLNAQGGLLVLDTFEELADITAHLRQQVLPALEVGVKVVISGREPLGRAWTRGTAGPGAIRQLMLTGFDRTDATAYLARRGIEEPALVSRMYAATGGHPLALTLGADLGQQFGLERFPPQQEWRLAVRSLVESLLRHLADPDLLALLEACTVVRVFDEETLAALTGRADVGEAFGRLCRLSAVRATEHGLMLHDDVRSLLAQDLRWRRPEHYRTLRLRALTHLRERGRCAPPAERERLLAERLYLCESGVVQQMLFGENAPGRVWIEPADPEHHEEILALEERWMRELLPAYEPELASAPFDADAHLRWIAALLDLPGRRARVAREDTGTAVGFALLVPVSQQSLPLLAEHEVIGPALHALFGADGLAALPATAEQTDVYCFSQVSHSDVLPEDTYAALLRDILSALAHGQLFIGGLHRPSHQALVTALGFRHIPGSAGCFRGQGSEGFALDLRAVGIEPWLNALVAGTLPPALSAAELETELRAVLVEWSDDRVLDRSPLLSLVADAEPATADRLRQLILRTLDLASARSAENQRALRAVRLAYLGPVPSHDRAAEQLSVSRATFFRLLRRGVQLLAETLPAAI